MREGVSGRMKAEGGRESGTLAATLSSFILPSSSLLLSALEVARGLCAGRGLLLFGRLRHLDALGAGSHAPVEVCDLFGREAVDVRLVVVDARARHHVGLLEAQTLGLRHKLLHGHLRLDECE